MANNFMTKEEFIDYIRSNIKKGENKMIMPEVDYKKVGISTKVTLKCEMVYRLKTCSDKDCWNCALGSVENYKKWKAEQKQALIKWPIRPKQRFFTLPRALVNKMPVGWKKRFLRLLNEFNDKNESEYIFNVSVVKNGKYVKMPDEFKI